MKKKNAETPKENLQTKLEAWAGPILVFGQILCVVVCGVVTYAVGVCPDRINPDLGCRLAITACGIFDIIFAAICFFAAIDEYL